MGVPRTVEVINEVFQQSGPFSKRRIVNSLEDHGIHVGTRTVKKTIDSMDCVEIVKAGRYATYQGPGSDLGSFSEKVPDFCEGKREGEKDKKPCFYTQSGTSGCNLHRTGGKRSL